MGVRGELFTTEVSLDNRTYFFNVKENRNGDVFLQVVESKNLDGAGFDRHAIVVFEDDMQRFLQGLESTLRYIEKNRKTKQKDAAERGETGKKKIIRRKTDSVPRDSRPRASDGDKREEAKKPARRVKVISKKDQKKT